jgi:Domain of unknown function DUF11
MPGLLLPADSPSNRQILRPGDLEALLQERLRAASKRPVRRRVSRRSSTRRIRALSAVTLLGALSIVGAAATLGHVPGAEVQVVKAASVSSIAAGGAFDYKLIGFNKGNEIAHNVVISDDLADTLVVKTATWQVNPPVGAAGTCTVGAGNAVSCSVGALAASDGDSVAPEPDSVFVRIHVVAPKAACGTIDNTAHVSSTDEPAENTHNDTSNTVSVTVTCGSGSLPGSSSPSAKPSGSPEGNVEAATPQASRSVPNTALDLPPTGGAADLLLFVVLYLVTGTSLVALAVESRKRRF